jgi:hypothetical protein
MRLFPRTKSLFEAHSSRAAFNKEAEVFVAVVVRWRGGWLVTVVERGRGGWDRGWWGI